MIFIYGLIDPRDPGHVRYIGSTTKISLENCYYQDVNAINTTRRKWLNGLKSDGIIPEIKQIVKLKDGEDLYYHLKFAIREFHERGHKLYNIKNWLMERKVNKIEMIKIKIILRNLREKFKECKIIGMHDGWRWHIMCNDFEFYMHDKKFKVWKKIIHKKNKFDFVFCYSSKADKDTYKLTSQFKNYTFL